MLHRHLSIQENSEEKNALDISAKPGDKHCSNERPVHLDRHHLVCTFTLAIRKKQTAQTFPL